MPIPTYDFDPFDPIPRKAVPVRFACLVADWTPAFLAKCVVDMVGPRGRGDPLRVYEYDSARYADGLINPSHYLKYCGRNTKIITPEDLKELPANHYVWSDDLIRVLDEAVNQTLEPWEEDTGLIWNPALGDCRDVVAECPDLSDYREQPTDECADPTDSLLQPMYNDRFHQSGDGWTLTYEGKSVTVKDGKGIRYIEHLMRRPGKEIPANTLSQEINLPLGEHVGTDANQLFGDDLEDEGTLASGLDDLGETVDSRTIKECKSQFIRNKERIEDARERGKHKEADELEEENQKILDHLSKNTDIRGRPRKMASSSKKTYDAVSSAIRRGVETITKYHPGLGQHLTDSIEKEKRCFCYKPSTEVHWEWKP